MKKILYIVSTLKNSGPTNQLSYIVKYLDKNKFEAVVLTLSPEPKNGSMKSYFTDTLKVKVDSLNLSRLQGLLFARHKVYKYIKKNCIDLVHSQGIRADGLIKHIDIPTVITLHNYPYYDYLSKFGWIKGRLMVFNHMKTINSNHLNCIACAESISKEFEQNNLQLDFIQNGVDVEKFKPLSHDEKISLKMNFNIHKEKVFITVGSLIPRKDVATVIKGFKAYNKNNGSLLLIAGGGFEESSLKSLSDNDNGIVFLGNVSNVVEYLQLSDCFISASLAEGLPNTVLEAMSCGLPTVLSNIPSHQELYRDKQGIFFNKKDSNKLSELLLNISNDFNIQKKISLSLVSNNFSAKMMSEKYQEKYQEKLNGSI